MPMIIARNFDLDEHTDRATNVEKAIQQIKAFTTQPFELIGHMVDGLLLGWIVLFH